MRAMPTRLLEPLALWFSPWHSCFLWSRPLSSPWPPSAPVSAQVISTLRGGHGRWAGVEDAWLFLWFLLWIPTSHRAPVCPVLSRLPPEGGQDAVPVCLAGGEGEGERRKTVDGGALQSNSGSGLHQQQQQGGWKLTAGSEVPNCLLPPVVPGPPCARLRALLEPGCAQAHTHTYTAPGWQYHGERRRFQAWSRALPPSSVTAPPHLHLDFLESSGQEKQDGRLLPAVGQVSGGQGDEPEPPP